MDCDITPAAVMLLLEDAQTFHFLPLIEACRKEDSLRGLVQILEIFAFGSIADFVCKCD